MSGKVGSALYREPRNVAQRSGALPSDRMQLSRRHVAAAQSVVFLTSGLWPIVSLRTFEMVTGPKLEGWLVKTVGLLIASVGTGLALGAARGRVSDEMAHVGGLSAAALAGIDVRYASKPRRISRVYLWDAALEAVWVAGWMLTARRQTPAQPTSSR
jgi:hypothetical protein